MPDVGNPNAFKLYQGKFAVTATDQLDHFCMLTIMNEVIFCGNYTADSSGDIATLPTELRPESNIKFPVVCSDDSIAIVTVTPAGTVKSSSPSKQHLLRGRSYNICCNYYAGE